MERFIYKNGLAVYRDEDYTPIIDMVGERIDWGHWIACGISWGTILVTVLTVGLLLGAWVGCFSVFGW